MTTGGDTKTLRVVVIGDSESAQTAVKNIGKSAKAAEKDSGGLVKALGGLKSIIGAGLALGGLSSLGGFFKDSVTGALEADKATRVLESQIKNLGASGQKAFRGASSFAEKFANSIGVDDASITPVMAKLASFPQAFKKGSDGADGMQRSVKAAFDLQAIGIGTAESNIIGIGKAMNDPIKGMTALNKSGVSFSAEQKTQIANYMKQGKLAQAQQVLLKGIESNAKGAAEAAVGPVDRMKATLHNAGEAVATMLVPMISKFADIMTTKIIPKVEAFAFQMGPKIGAALSTASHLIGEIASALGPKIAVGLGGLGKAAKFLVDALGNPVVKAFAVTLGIIIVGMQLYSTTVGIVTKVTKIWTTVQALLDGTLDANPIGMLVIGIAALVAGVIYAYTHFKTFREIVQACWSGIKVATEATVNFFKNIVWPGIKWVFDQLAAKVRDFKTTFVNDWNAMHTAYVNVVNWFRSGWSAISGAITSMKNGVQSLRDKWNSMMDSIGSRVTSVLNGCKSAFTNAKNTIGSEWAKLQGLAKGPVNFVINTVYNRGIRAFWNAIATKVGASALPAIAGLAGGGVPSMAGVAGDFVPLYGQAGEYMLNRKQVSRAGGWRGVESVFGPAGRDGASAGHYDGGGIVGGIKNAGSWLASKGSSLIRGSLLTIASPLINTIKSLISQIPGTGDIANAVRGLPTKALDSILGWLKPKDVQQGVGSWNGTIQPGIIGTMQKWALAQAGKRYLWSAVGPANYDCSGMVGNLWALATGNPLYRRYMSTSDMGAGRHGMVSGPGAFTIYLNRAGGHTAANVGGLHAEAYGGNGTLNAIGRIGERLSFFNELLHLPGLAAGGTVAERLSSFMERGWPEPPLGVQVPMGFKPLAWRGVKQETFDSGGILRPGTTIAHNRTGRNEYVVTGDQAGGITVNVTVQGNVTSEKDLAESIATTVRDALLRKAARNGGKTGL